MKLKYNGYWTKKDGTEYVYVEKTFKAGYVTGFQYFIIDGKEVMSMTPFKATFEVMLKDYEKGMH